MNASNLVLLREGLAVPVGAVSLQLDLERRGLTIRIDDDGGLLIGPRRHLTARDRVAIQGHRDQLVALVQHEPQVVQ